jgi:hypothetical protein
MPNDDRISSPIMTGTDNGWREWSRYVLKQLESLQEHNEKMSAQIDELRLELAVSKLKSGFWGAISGIATTVTVIGIEYLRRR